MKRGRVRNLPGDEAARAGWLCIRPDCRSCGEFFDRAPSQKDGRPDYAHPIPECRKCFEKRIKKQLAKRLAESDLNDERHWKRG